MMDGLNLKAFSVRNHEDRDEEIKEKDNESQSNATEQSESQQYDENDSTVIMLKRWSQILNNMTLTDRADIATESVYFGKKGLTKQGQPEFAQSMYLRVRQNEEAFGISNYLADSETHSKGSEGKKRFISEYDRSYAI
jgi:hypothetical protein